MYTMLDVICTHVNSLNIMKKCCHNNVIPYKVVFNSER